MSSKQLWTSLKELSFQASDVGDDFFEQEKFVQQWIALFDQVQSNPTSKDGPWEEILIECANQPQIIKHAIPLLSDRFSWITLNASGEEDKTAPSVLKAITHTAISNIEIRQLWSQYCSQTHKNSGYIFPLNVIEAIFDVLNKDNPDHLEHAFNDSKFTNVLVENGIRAPMFQPYGVFYQFIEQYDDARAPLWNKCFKFISEKNTNHCSKWELECLNVEKLSTLKQFDPMRHKHFFYASQFSRSLRMHQNVFEDIMSHSNCDNPLPFQWMQLNHEGSNDTFWGQWLCINQALFKCFNALDYTHPDHQTHIDNCLQYSKKVASYTMWDKIPAQIFNYSRCSLRYDGPSVLSEHGEYHRKILEMMANAFERQPEDYKSWSALVNVLDEHKVIDWVVLRQFEMFSKQSSLWEQYFEENPNHHLKNLIKPLLAFGESSSLINHHKWGNDVLPDMAGLVLSKLFNQNKWEAAWEMMEHHQYSECTAPAIDQMTSQVIQNKDPVHMKKMYQYVNTYWGNELNRVFNDCVLRVFLQSDDRTQFFSKKVIPQNINMKDPQDQSFLNDFMSEGIQNNCFMDHTYLRKRLSGMPYGVEWSSMEQFLPMLEKMLIQSTLPTNQISQKKRVL